MRFIEKTFHRIEINKLAYVHITIHRAIMQFIIIDSNRRVQCILERFIFMKKNLLQRIYRNVVSADVLCGPLFSLDVDSAVFPVAIFDVSSAKVLCITNGSVEHW